MVETKIIVRLYEQLLEIKAALRESELKHTALIRALEKNGIIIRKEIEQELLGIIKEVRAGL